MSSGQHHAGMTKGIASGIGLGAISSYFLTPIEISFMAIGCLFGLFLSPDADVDGGYIGFWYIRKVFGKGGEFIWKIIWEPYQRALKHRSFWSHTPVIGTVVRLIYCVVPLIIILLKDQQSTPILEIIPKSFLAQLVAIPFIAMLTAMVYVLYTKTNADLLMVGLSLFVGLCISDIGHWILDL